MSNQELIDIAHRFKKYARGNSGFPEQHMRALADHILDTVWEDDDEPLSVEWLLAVGFKPTVICYRYELMLHPGCWLTWDETGDICLSTGYSSLLPVKHKTRGQLRILCRVFGVTLPEGGAA